MQKRILLAALCLSSPAFAQSQLPPVPAPSATTLPTIAALSGHNTFVASTLANISQRAPLPSDTAQGVGGLWIDWSVKQPYILNSINGEGAFWQRVVSPGQYAATALGGAAGSWGTHCTVAGWSQPIVVITRPSDGNQTPIGCIDGKLDMATAAAFAYPSGGIAYIIALHDMTDNGAYDGVLNTAYDTTQSVLSEAPRLGILYEASGGNAPIVWDSLYRNYRLTSHVWALTANPSGTLNAGATAFCIPSTSTENAIMGPGAPGLWFWYPGVQLQGSGIGTSNANTVSTFSYTTGCGTLAAPTTGTVNTVSASPSTTLGSGNLTEFLNLPSTLSVPQEGHAFMAAGRFGTSAMGSVDISLLGQSVATAQNTSNQYVAFRTGGSVYAGVSLSMDSGNGSNATDDLLSEQLYVPSFDQVFGYSNYGSTGRNVYYQFLGQQGNCSNCLAGIPAVNLTGGSIGYTQQHPLALANTGKNVDFALYDFTYYASSQTPAQMTTYTMSDDLALGITPQCHVGLGVDGSSTTAYNGWTSAFMWGADIATKVSALQCLRVWDQATGGGPALSAFNWSTSFGALVPSYLSTIVYWPGMGDGTQAGATIAVTGMTPGNATITTSTSLLSYGQAATALAPGVELSGTGCLADGATVASIIDNNDFTVSNAAQVTGTCSSIHVLNDTAKTEWAEFQSYANTASAAGAQVLWIGSASRMSYYSTGGVNGSSNPDAASGTQLGEFATIKAYLLNACNVNVATGIGGPCAGLPGSIGYIDLELVSQGWGGDAGTTTVVGPVVAGNQVTVNVPGGNEAAVYLAAGNRVEWAGMPTNIAADTGGQTISAITGLTNNQATITLTGTNSGLVAGQIIRAINPTPWTSFPCLSNPPLGPWNGDGQHMCFPLGYDQVANLALGLLMKSPGYLN